LFLFQRRHGHGNGEVSFTGSGRADAEDDIMLLNRLNVITLTG